jgi:hypothetical protein
VDGKGRMWTLKDGKGRQSTDLTDDLSFLTKKQLKTQRKKFAAVQKRFQMLSHRHSLLFFAKE